MAYMHQSSCHTSSQQPESASISSMSLYDIDPSRDWLSPHDGHFIHSQIDAIRDVFHIGNESVQTLVTIAQNLPTLVELLTTVLPTGLLRMEAIRVLKLTIPPLP